MPGPHRVLPLLAMLAAFPTSAAAQERYGLLLRDARLPADVRGAIAEWVVAHVAGRAGRR